MRSEALRSSDAASVIIRTTKTNMLTGPAAAQANAVCTIRKYTPNFFHPDVVWFGESLPQDVWQEAIIQANSCDMMIIAGTSLVVSPANTLPIYAKENNAILIEVNPEETVMSQEMQLSLKTTSANALPELISIFQE